MRTSGEIASRAITGLGLILWVCAGQAAPLPPAIELNAAAFAVTENAGPLVVRVARRGDLSGTSAVMFTTSNDTALAGVDFIDVAGVITFAPGESSKTFSVSLLDDSVPETNRVFGLRLFDPQNAALDLQSNATVTIVDDEFLAVLDPWFNPEHGADNDIFTMALTPEGRIVIGGQFLSFNQVPGLRSVARLLPDGRIDPAFELEDGLPNGPVYAVALQSNGDIIIGGDFTAVGAAARPYLARLTRRGALDPGFAPAGINNGIRSIIAQPDGKVLIAGRFTQVAGISRARIARLQADGSIDATFDPGTGANNSIRTLAQQPDGRVLIAGQFTAFAGDSRNRIARLMANGALDPSFNPGAGTDDEVRSVALQADGRIFIGGDFENYDGVLRSSVARLFSDGALDPAFDPGPSADDFVRVVAPAAGGKVWIGGSFNSAGGAIRRNLALLGANGLADAFDPGSVEQEVFAVLPQPDGQTLVSGDFISINGISFRRIARLNTGRPPPQFQSGLSDAVAEETAGRRVLTVLRQGDYAVAAETDYQTSDGTAEAGADYSALAGTLRFEPMEAAKLIDIPILNDSLTEPAEIFSLRLTNPVAPATLGVVANTVITLRNDDAGFEFAADAFGGSEPAGAAAITVWRGGTGIDTVSVDYQVAPGTAQAGIDYLATNGTLVFQPGETQKTFIVRIVADALAEGTETALLTLTNASANAALGARRAVALSIEDVDSTFTWGFREAALEYGGPVSIFIERRGVLSLQATVDYETLHGTAMPGEDYVAVTNTLEFLPGEAYRWFRFDVLNDGLVEGPETFLLHLTRPTGGAVVGTNSNAVITIEDNDGGMAFTETNIAVSENSASVTLTVARYDDGPGPLAVEYFTNDGTARAGANYTARSGTLMISEPLGSNTVTIPLFDECSLMSERTFTVVLSNPSPGGALGSNSVAVVSIRGNDQPGVRDLSFVPAFAQADRLLALPDGKLLLGGATPPPQDPLSNYHYSLALLDRNGSIDPGGPLVREQAAVFLMTAMARADDGRIYTASVRIEGEGMYGSLDGVGYFWVRNLRPGITGIVPLPDGRIVVGGDFNFILPGCCPRFVGVARQNADGSSDESFRPGTGAFANEISSGVSVVALDGMGRILVGGVFTSFNGVPRPGLARLQPDGALDLTFDPGGGPTNAGYPGVACILPLANGQILIGGWFTHVNGVERSRVARLNPDGSLDPSFDPGPIPDGSIGKIVRQLDGKFILAGSFTSVNGRHRGGIARLFADGALDSAFDPGLDDYFVTDLALQPDGRIVLIDVSRGLVRLEGDPVPSFSEVRRESNRDLRLHLKSRPGETYTLQDSTNLLDWLPLQTNLATGCALEFIIPASPEANRFYRAVQLIP